MRLHNAPTRAVRPGTSELMHRAAERPCSGTHSMCYRVPLGLYLAHWARVPTLTQHIYTPLPIRRATLAYRNTPTRDTGSCLPAWEQEIKQREQHMIVAQRGEQKACAAFLLVFCMYSTLHCNSQHLQLTHSKEANQQQTPPKSTY